MNQYFGNFPLINYNNRVMYNIMDRTAILNSVFGDVYAFYPYHVKNGMRADTVAERYYGDPDLVWLVYFSNNIVDPYHDWPMDDNTFNTFIADKYGSVQQAYETIVDYRINWFEDTRTLSQLQYNSLQGWEKKYWTPVFDINNNAQGWVRKELDISAVSVDINGTIYLSPPSVQPPVNITVPEITGITALGQTISVDTGTWESGEEIYWTSVSAYDYEQEQNADKSNIRLLDAKLAPVAVANIEKLMSTP